MWLDPVLGVDDGLWKSWITHRAPPQQVLAGADFVHMVPSPAGIVAQRVLATQQGRADYGSRAATPCPSIRRKRRCCRRCTVAEGLGGGSARTRRLRRRPAPDFSA